MLSIRKAFSDEKDLVLETANRAFIPERNSEFDFRVVMPKIYDNNLDYTKEHFVVFENNNIISTGGNLLRNIKVDDNNYLCSFVGSISTLPEHQGKGGMKMLMKAIEEENIQNSVVCSILTGVRCRYNYFGYEKCSQRVSFTFDKYLVNHSIVNNSFIIKQYDSNLLDEYYELYTKYQPVVIRDKSDFEISLRKRDTRVFGIFDNNSLIGYFGLSINKKQINEISINNPCLLKDVIISILKDFNLDEVTVFVNPLYKEVIAQLNLFSESISFFNYSHIRIYDIVRFLEMVLNLNKKVINFNELKELYKVNNQGIEITFVNNKFNVKLTNEADNLANMTLQEFTRLIFGVENLYSRSSNIFPILFDVNEGDLF